MPGLKDYKPLRLMVGDADDLKVLSAVLQDAIAKVGDFAHVPSQRRFAFVANRFVWEDAADKKRGPFARVRAGCHFDDVLAVRQMNLRPDAKDGVLNLLAIRFEPSADGAGAVMFDFAGGGAIRLEVESLNAQLADMSEPWPARAKPAHEE
ncbi:MAG: hypothetical protein A3E78_04150 [Alphaproteobacteria bacterium RIFCSPHIGHO2_12_FULL_63_12]|nr:MAG: hypothetical protein A3E78_04150 [Alphaproteobacteria bacterium RIFCSPHIGHO2_12_FULL_63_12]